MQTSQNIKHQSPPLAGTPGAEAIILAGGLGTRLRSAVSDLPKCMAPVAGKPFLHYVIAALRKQDIHKFIFSLGYKSEVIQTYLSAELPQDTWQAVVEDEPLGTGGAILAAVKKAIEQHVYVLNGDTIFAADMAALMDTQLAMHAACTLCLKPMENFERYGAVELDEGGVITAFKEKKFYKKGLINGGVYALDSTKFLQESLPEKFSFEKDYLEKKVTEQVLHGFVQDEYFIDIGIPEDYRRAQAEFENLTMFK